jgi:acylpyruvate hydrolase
MSRPPFLTVENAFLTQFIFSIPKLIHYISQVVTLEPGDIIATGTPGGGFARNPTGIPESGRSGGN